MFRFFAYTIICRICLWLSKGALRMSKVYTKEDVIQNKKEAIKELNQLLESYINEPSQNHLKKAHLISYWIKDFINFISFEEYFDPTKNIAYKRGNIVKINFGFNIGSEYGGLHYGVVLDNHNAHNSPVITIIPLTSIKENKIAHSNNVVLGNEIYKTLKIKYDTVAQSLTKEKEQIQDMIKVSDALKKMAQLPAERPAQEYLMLSQKIEAEWKEKELHNQKEMDYLEKIGQEIAHMKEGSIALVNQLTTVSKMRIFDPRNVHGVLSGISLSAESMTKINQKVKELFVFEKNDIL